MDTVKNSDEFKSGIKEKAGDVIEGAKGLVSDPIGSVSGAVSGVGKLFSRGKENLLGGSRSEAEGSRMADLIGYSKTKRDYAYDFGVDVYSRNELLQEHLDDIARAGHAGSLSMTVLLAAVPGAAGTAVTITGGTELMNKVFRDSAPADLRKMNRKKLSAMGVNKDIADLFISNGVFTPREQTILVSSLKAMKNTKNRDQYIKFAILTDNADIAFFRQRQAQMYEAYNRTVEPINEFVTIGQVSAGKTSSGKIIFNAPLDHLIWTKNMAAFASIITRKVSMMEGVTGREIWVAGSMSPLAKESIAKMGWSVKEHAGKLLLQ
jgi:hypothetical protein